MPSFTRPNSLQHPTIYHTFTAQDKHSKELIKFTVQDLPEDRFEQAIQFMIQHFMEDEVMGQSRRIKADRDAMKDISAIWRDLVKERLSIVCFKENSDDIIGLNMMRVKSKDEKEEPINWSSKNLRDIFNTMEYAWDQFDAYEYYQVEHLLIAYGLCVDTSYRGRGIATEMLKARIPLLKAIGLTVTSTIYTGPGSQAAARKAGYQETFDITYDDLYNADSDFLFPKIAAKSMKIMGFKI